MKNAVRRSRLFQDLFDCRRDFDQVFGRVRVAGHSRKRHHLQLPLLPVIESSVDKDNKAYFFSSVAPRRPSGESSSFACGEGKRSRPVLQRKTERSEKDVDFHCEEIRIIRTNIHPARKCGHGVQANRGLRLCSGDETSFGASSVATGSTKKPDFSPLGSAGGVAWPRRKECRAGELGIVDHVPSRHGSFLMSGKFRPIAGG